MYSQAPHLITADHSVQEWSHIPWKSSSLFPNQERSNKHTTLWLAFESSAQFKFSGLIFKISHRTNPCSPRDNLSFLQWPCSTGAVKLMFNREGLCTYVTVMVSCHTSLKEPIKHSQTVCILGSKFFPSSTPLTSMGLHQRWTWLNMSNRYGGQAKRTGESNSLSLSWFAHCAAICMFIPSCA